MSVDQRCDEESLQHIHALLEKHEWSEVCRMVRQVASHRPVSTTSASRTSVFSGKSTDSRFSALSTDYAPSVPSSASSYSRPQWDPSIHGPGLNPTRPAPLSISSPNSQSSSPMDTFFKHLPCPTDSDSRSVASSATRRSGLSTNGGRWFCTFCTAHTSFGAKSDWKKHETRLHETGEDWPCPIRNCFQIFDRQADYLKHCQRHHPDIPPPTDIKIRLLPRLVYGCGFDGCKAVLIGWNERCNHVADLHMKEEGLKQSDWKYSNVIHNLLRQDITRSAWKELFSVLTKQSRCQITWRPENTRILKQKLECGDMRPSIDVVLHTALSLREGRPFNDVVELDPSFRTPSQDSIPNFHHSSRDQLNRILRGNLTTPFPRIRSNTLTASIHRPSDSNTTNFVEPHPGTLVQFDTRPYTEGSMTDANRRRISFMEIDETDPDMPPEPDPQIPPGLDLDPFQIDPTMTPKPIDFCYSDSIDTSSMIDGSPYQRRSSKGHILPKSLRHFTSRLSPKQTSPHANQQEGSSEFSAPRSYSSHA